MFEILNYLFAGGIIFSHVIGYIVSGISILFVYKNWNVIKKEKIIIFIMLFMIYGFISACFAPYAKRAFDEMFTYLTSWLFPFILGYYILDNIKKEKIIKVYVVIFALVIAVSILSYFGLFYQEIAGSQLARKGMHLHGLRWHISLGAMCVLLFCFSLVILLFKNNLTHKQKIRLFLLTLLFIVSLYLTGSRGYYIAGFITYLAIFCFYIYKTKKLKIPLIISLVSLSIIAILFATNPFMQSRIENTSLTSEESLTIRINLYKVALNVFKKHFIFGVGPRQGSKQPEFYDITKDISDDTVHLHSIYLSFLAEFGTVGFVLFLCIIFLILKRLYLLYKKENSLLALCMLFAWISLLIGDCFDTVLRGPRVAMDYFWLTGLVLGGTLKITSKKEDNNEKK